MVARFQLHGSRFRLPDRSVYRVCQGSALRDHPAFTLVEVLVALAIIVVLIAILIPAATSARRRSKQVGCQSNLHQIGVALSEYAQRSSGYPFPPALGANAPPDERWPVYVLHVPRGESAVLICPADEVGPVANSYLLNEHLLDRQIRYQSKKPGRPASTIIVAGEKVTDQPRYYLRSGEYDMLVELHRHGRQKGANYLYLDSHVDAEEPKLDPVGHDPWDVPWNVP